MCLNNTNALNKMSLRGVGFLRFARNRLRNIFFTVIASPRGVKQSHMNKRQVRWPRFRWSPAMTI